MPEDKATIVILLKGLKPFEGLSDEQLALVASVTNLLEIKEGQGVDLPSDRDYPFYAVATGKVQKTLQSWRKEKPVWALKKNDFFGADVAILGSRRIYTLVALKPTQLLTIEAGQLATLLRMIPRLKENLRTILRTYKALQSRRFDWVTEDEEILLVTNKHPAYLFVALLGPLALAWSSLLPFMVNLLSPTVAVSLVADWLGIGILIAAGLWAAWTYVDFINDYYVVTDGRVVEIESVVGLYSNREEAPLSAIKNEEVTTSFFGRMLGFGSVVSHAFMGDIRFENIAEPAKVRDLITSLRKAAAGQAVAADRVTMANLVRRRINPPPPAPPAPPAPPPAKTRIPLDQRLQKAFSTYIIEGDTITYRKHLLVLLRHVAAPSLLIVAVLGLATWLYILRVGGQIDFPSPVAIILTPLFLILPPLAFWWGWHYVDWSNDIYRITADKIIDSEKKPLGDEVTKSAPLENIFSMELERKGFIGVVFNFGNVVINTGTDSKFIFLNINNPARAQRDIYAKKYAMEQKRRTAEITKRGEEIVDWLAAYHHVSDELRRPKDTPQT